MATETYIELQSLNHHEADAKEFVSAVSPSCPGRTVGSSISGLHPDVAIAQPEVVVSKLSGSRAWILVVQLGGFQFASSFSSGMLTIGLPTIATALKLQPNLLLWPNSVYYLSSGACFLIAGSVADVLGPKRMYLPGCFLVSMFILACGLAEDGISFIMFRAFQGVASSLVIPCAVSMVSTNIEHGTPRNMGFASIFMAAPLGFALGWILEGLFINSVGWRVGFYLSGAIGIVLCLIAAWTLPKDQELGSMRKVFKRLANEIDWVGALLASTSVALLSYVLAMLSAGTSYIHKATNIALLTLSLACIPVFVFWMRRQEKNGRPALIPNYIWKKTAFTSICLMILLSNAVITCNELFCSLFFQEVQLLTPTQTSIRLLPQVVVGMTLCFLGGVFVNRIPVLIVVMVSTILCAGAPVLMATINPSWPYWYSAFWAQILAPVSIDILYTVGTLTVSAAFPAETQAIAGAVFSTFAQLGTSIGLCILSIVSTSVTAKSRYEDKSSPQALMEGYRASFWTLFAWTMTACAIGAVGLRKIGRVGMKRE